MDLQSLVSKIPNPSKYVIDIGASHAPESDPVHTFLKNDQFKGLCIEARNEQIPLLKQNIASTFDIYNGFITPLNVLDVFHQYNVPHSPDILKIDIDGYDLEVLRTILREYRPKIIIAEINEKIPYPVIFEVKFKEDYRWDVSHFYGFSIAAGEKEMDKNQYRIVNVFDLCNIVCVANEVLNDLDILHNSSVKELYRLGYAENPRRPIVMYYNENVNHWLTLQDTNTLKQDIQTYFAFVNDRSQRNKKFLKDIDYILE